jgi:hypothetical protein
MVRHASHQSLLRSTLLLVGAAAAMLPAAARAGGPYQYFAVTPCRVVDTRTPNAVDGGPALVAGQERDFAIRGQCGVPTTATAVTLNVTIVQPNITGPPPWIAVWPSGQPRPTVSTLNFTNADGALANGAIVPVSTNAHDLAVILGASGGTVHVLLDVTGYFE